MNESWCRPEVWSRISAHRDLCLAAVLHLHLGQTLVGVLQQILDVLCVLLLQLELRLLHLGESRVQLQEGSEVT